MFFNRKAKATNLTTNHEGAPAYTLTPEMALYTTVVTASLGNQFYENSADRVERVRRLMTQCDPQFVAQLAVYTREQMYLRSIPLVLTVELAKIQRGSNLVGQLTERVIQRADELTEILAYYAMANGRTANQKSLGKLSKQLQAGIAAAFNKFDEYQFAKYNRPSAIKLRDALFLTHPKAKNEAQQVLFNKITNDELSTPYTWETELSALGQQIFTDEAAKTAAFRAKWEALIQSDKLGYMALLRNLRNMLELEVSAVHIIKVCHTLSDARQVAQSKQLPFRFLAAYRELLEVKSGFTPMLLTALENAVMASIANMRGFDANTRVTIACDVSGSMQKPISAKSKVLNYDIGLMLGMMLRAKCTNVITGMFGDTWKSINLPAKNILQNVQEFYRREGEVGYSTNGYLVIEDLLKRNQVMDKVMMFTDCQLWDSTGQNTSIQTLWQRYRQTVAPNARLYLFDLAGLGQTPLDTSKGNGVYLISGWSDKIFDVLSAIEGGGNAIQTIRQIKITE